MEACRGENIGSHRPSSKVVSSRCSGKRAQAHCKIEVLSVLPLLENRWDESKGRPKRTWIRRIHRRKPCIEERCLWVEMERGMGAGAVENSSVGLFLGSVEGVKALEPEG